MKITNEDNMELMARYEDNYFDLAIVDPPYGLGDKTTKGGCNKNSQVRFKEHKWDNEIPTDDYFIELKRVSKNQIIWGGNYMTEYLTPTPCWLLWDKGFSEDVTFAQFEMAWTSFDKVARYYRKNIAQVTSEGRMHPTQKPITLYEFILMNFAETGNKILDTHLGSGSIALACHNLGYDLTACELDKEYYEAAIKRIEQHKAQIRMF